MTERNVRFLIETVGANEHVRAMRQVAGAQDDVSDQMRSTSRSARDATRQQESLTAALQTQVAGWGTLGGAVGQVGSVIGRINPQLSGLSAAIGTLGQTIPTVATALAAPNPASVTSALVSVGAALGDGVLALQSFDQNLENVQDTTRSSADAFNSLVSSVREAREAFDGLLRASGAGAQQAAADRVAAAEQQVSTLTRTLATARARGGSPDFIEGLERRLSDAELQLNSMQFSASVIQGNTAREAASESARGARRGGGRRGPAGPSAAELETQATIEALQEQFQAEREHAGRLQDVRRGLADFTRELDEAEHEARLERIRQREAAEREAAERVREKQIDELNRVKEEAIQANMDLRDNAESVLAPAVSEITGALSNIIAGAESADQAFQGLLASFLEMLAQQAALEAAKEFAAAIASFASQDYAGGALHLAAGAAWTGVAIAAGAGAVAAAPSEAAAAEPETAQDSGGGGGGTNVYNINGTIISAEGSTARARAGQEIGALLEADQRRFGRAG